MPGTDPELLRPGEPTPSMLSVFITAPPIGNTCTVRHTLSTGVTRSAYYTYLLHQIGWDLTALLTQMSYRAFKVVNYFEKNYFNKGKF